MDDEYIETKVRELAQERNLKPIAARERGSRMLGVPHEDSDWDVFLLFAQEPAEYVKLGGYTDTVSRKFDDGDIDIHGWNVKKFANLTTDSNPNAIEFLMSQKEYFNDVDFPFGKIESDVQLNFNHMALYHHYLSLAKSNYEKYIESGNDCTKGRQFYVLRATAMAKHIREEGTFPALNVYDFLDQTDALDEELEGILTKLSDAKAAGQGEQDNPDIVGTFLDAEYDEFMEPTDERTYNPSRQILNELIEASI